MDERLKKQLEFLIEIDKVKNVFRRSYITDGTRQENDAEHSWHLGVMAILFSDYIEEDINIYNVIKMVLIHDLVEIYAGDTFAFDNNSKIGKCEREFNAAIKLFELLPKDQAVEFKSLWTEFEEIATRDAEYANMLDRLQPLILNYVFDDGSWKKYGVTKLDVYKRQEIILKKGPKKLIELVEYLVSECIKKGYLQDV